MLELLWLLLPVAAASGWYAARRGASASAARPASLPDGYFQGLNYLLNEQPDKAIEVFTRMVEVDSDTVETHLALGSLFRRRGEVDRAIRIHQNLIARPTLTREQRAHALLELGEDYMRAGLLDRAENLFEQLVQSDLHVEPALRHLLVVYQQEKDWQKAIDAALRIESHSRKPMRPLVAQLHCELAEQAREAGDLAECRQLLKRALSHDPKCVRASLMQGDLDREQGQWKSAAKVYLRVREQDLDFVPEMLEPLRECYEKLGQSDSFARFLEEVVPAYRGVAPVLMLAELRRQKEGARASADFLVDQLRRRPSMEGLAHLVDLTLENRGGDGQRSELERLRGLIQGLIQDHALYECGQCGFTAKSLYWQCPSCRSWATVKPSLGTRI